jgi:uncharacterized protein YutE (UPF0331/DUF86 family)
MVLKRDSITRRLQELDTVLQELAQHQGLERAAIEKDLSRRWIIERGLIAAAALILDVADHILAGHFGVYAGSYEESLAGLRDNQVISDELYRQIRGLGGFRNILVHMYQDIDVEQVWEAYQKALTTFPSFAEEVLVWLDQLAAHN